MRKIFWDTMLFIYMLENNREWGAQVHAALAVSRARGDVLFTSYLAVGELMAGSGGQGEYKILATLEGLGFHFLEFGKSAVKPFGRLRGEGRITAPDAIHLACAAAEGIDMFLTGDKRLLKLHVPGVKFIANLDAFLPAA